MRERGGGSQLEKATPIYFLHDVHFAIRRCWRRAAAARGLTAVGEAHRVGRRSNCFFRTLSTFAFLCLVAARSLSVFPHCLTHGAIGDADKSRVHLNARFSFGLLLPRGQSCQSAPTLMPHCCLSDRESDHTVPCVTVVKLYAQRPTVAKLSLSLLSPPLSLQQMLAEISAAALSADNEPRSLFCSS